MFVNFPGRARQLEQVVIVSPGWGDNISTTTQHLHPFCLDFEFYQVEVVEAFFVYLVNDIIEITFTSFSSFRMSPGQLSTRKCIIPLHPAVLDW